MLNKSELKINGVYEFENSNSSLGIRTCVITPKDKFPIGHMFLKNCDSGEVLFHLNNFINDKYPSWDRINTNTIMFSKYLGQYNWLTGEIESENEKESFLLNSYTSETLDIYEHGIFRAKVTTRNENQWVHFDSKGGFDYGIYGYTKDEFLELMLILREIEEKFLKDEEN